MASDKSKNGDSTNRAEKAVNTNCERKLINVESQVKG